MATGAEALTHLLGTLARRPAAVAARIHHLLLELVNDPLAVVFVQLAFEHQPLLVHRGLDVVLPFFHDLAWDVDLLNQNSNAEAHDF